ncbi:MAG: hypothetical protein WBE85_04700 [Methylocella sp.]
MMRKLAFSFAPPSAMVHRVALVRDIGINGPQICQTGQIRAHIAIQYPSHLGNVGLGQVS